jgi:hypothetical protein
LSFVFLFRRGNKNVQSQTTQEDNKKEMEAETENADLAK